MPNCLPSCHTVEETNAGCGIEKSGMSYTNLFPDFYTKDIKISKDLAEFHLQWQRMNRPGTNLLKKRVLYNQTLNYVDDTIFVLNASNHSDVEAE